MGIRTGSMSGVVAVTAVCALAAACGTESAVGTARTAPAPAIAWSPCELTPAPASTGTAAPSSPAGPALECGTLAVPLDHSRPDAAKIELAMVRAGATGSDRLGSLVFNFGGPGGSGVQTLPALLPSYAALNARYDLVSFDPRGVGFSSPVKCLDDRRADAMNALDSSPDTPEEAADLERGMTEGVQACEKNSGRILPYVGTADAARDLDAIRLALGDAKLNFFGISYGTQLGANYAHQFPAEVGRTVLDAAVDPSLTVEQSSYGQAAGFQLALANYAADCARRACGLGKDADAVLKTVENLVAGLDARPLPTKDGRPLTQGLGVIGVVAPLYSESEWPTLTKALTAAKAGDGSGLLALADAQNGRDADGHYSNMNAALQAISCADTTERPGVQDVEEALPRFEEASPVFGKTIAWGMLSCSGWPTEGDDAGRAATAPTSATPIVVIGNINDPATPYANAPKLTKALGNARLVTLDGQGHGAYNTGNTCVQGIVNAYFNEGTVPANGVTCK
ncbi:alpha/beta hydrolase [Actinocorallia longicatena]|uniref:Alpha/beta fold hydrolase n=1 Tax=Actinocorallia longicatena TaxID=111803 RepID=A0ABP6PWS7_9ACTN